MDAPSGLAPTRRSVLAGAGALEDPSRTRCRVFERDTVPRVEAELVEIGATDTAVQLDLDAGMAAHASRTTPHVFLLRDGLYVTKVAGSVSLSVVKNALGL